MAAAIPTNSTVVATIPAHLGAGDACTLQQQPPDVQQLSTIMQMNGRKVMGPPENWAGPPPPASCELFIRRIPRDIDEYMLMQPFLRFGLVYEFRLPLDFQQGNRGFAYVKYATEEEADRAMEVMQHYFIQPRHKLEIVHSHEKCRLFVNNIPRNLKEADIEAGLRHIFPCMQRVTTRSGSATEGSRNKDGPSQQKPQSQQLQLMPPPSAEQNEAVAGDELAVAKIDRSADKDSGINEEDRQPSTEIHNRGFALIQFPSHLHALEAKKNTTPGIIRMWGRDLRVVWANNEREMDSYRSSHTLFVRNVDMSVTNHEIVDMLMRYITRKDFRKVSRVRSAAFLDFATREVAEYILRELQGITLRGRRLHFEWARPSEQQSLHRIRHTDFDAMLRLKCMANYWQLPIIIFGTYFAYEGIQYGAVMLRDATGVARGVFCIMMTTELSDIHSRMCEAVCALLEHIGSFPHFNYVMYVQKDNAHLIGTIIHNHRFVEFSSSFNVPHDLFVDLNELIDLSWSIAVLAANTEEMLLQVYHDSFRSRAPITYLNQWVIYGHRTFGAIFPKYRNKPSLKYNLNDTQVVLALCYIMSGTNANLANRQYIPFHVNLFDNDAQVIHYMVLKLMPLALAQARSPTYNLSCVVFGNHDYYHPQVRSLYPPLWVSVCPYTKSLVNPRYKGSTAMEDPKSTRRAQHKPQSHKSLKKLVTSESSDTGSASSSSGVSTNTNPTVSSSTTCTSNN